MINDLIDYFVPTHVAVQGRASRELARTFVFTHLFGPVIASPMGIYLIVVSPEVSASLVIVITSIVSFQLLPFLLKWTGRMELCALLSFQGLASASLYGTFHYGGVSSPFLPWLIVSLLLGFFYLSKRIPLVVGLFSLTLTVFIACAYVYGFPVIIPVEQLRPMGWLSILAAAAYMTWMALYYSRMIAMRDDLELEAERYLKTLEELDAARQVAETMHLSKTRFFSKMSHELRTPLNAIIGYSDLLMEDVAERQNESSQKVQDIARINAAGKHLLSLFSEVLDISSLERDANRMEISAFKISKLCEEVVASIKPMIEAKNNQLVIECRDATVRTDERKMRQTLINLLSNSAKFTENGTITLKLSAPQRPDGRRLIAMVTDTGIGIAADALPNLFDSYIQADETISERFGGTGLGLSLSRKFAVMMGGEIDVTSKPGKGSTFTVDVPADLEIVEMDPPESPAEDANMGGASLVAAK